MKNPKKIVTAIIMIIVGTGFIALMTMASLWVLRGINSGFGAVQVCHSLERDAQPLISKMLQGRQVEGKLYECGGRRGEVGDQEYNALTYTLRGSYSDTLTSATLFENLSTLATTTGWQRNDASAQNSRPYFAFSAAPDRKLRASIDVISPKHQLFNLTITTVDGAYKTSGDDTTPLTNQVPDADLHAQYPSFRFVEPRFIPEGYAEAWRREDPRAWRADRDPEPSAFRYAVANSYSLAGGSAGDDGYLLQQRLYEADDSSVSRRLAGLLPLGTTQEGHEVYGDLALGETSIIKSFTLKRRDSLVVLSWDAGADSYKSNFLNTEQAFRVFESLGPKD